MALKTDKNLKLYYSIKEVSQILDISESNLRFWEKEFPEIAPKKSSKGFRQYTEKNIEQLKLIKRLVKENGMTLKGARQKIKENPGKILDLQEVLTRLNNVKMELTSIIDEFDSTPPYGKPF